MLRKRFLCNAKDHDDAIYFDNQKFILYVAIVDISAYIKDGSNIDIEAKKHASSIYLSGTVYPMLPNNISNNLCSLKPNVKKDRHFTTSILDCVF